jgi:hypothetical protein
VAGFDFSEDFAMLESVLARDHATERRRAENLRTSISHARAGARLDLVRPLEREREPGRVRGRERPGEPETGTNADVYSRDAAGRAVAAFTLSSGRPWSVSYSRWEAGERSQVSFDIDEDGNARAVRAMVERYEGERLSHVAYLFDGVVLREDFVYGDHGLVEVVQRRSHPWDAGHSEQRQVVVRGDNGAAEAVIFAGSVVWRRGGRDAARKLSERLQDSLVSDLVDALLGVEPSESRAVVMLRHQVDGTWTDQALPVVAASGPAAGADPWAIASWAHPDVTVDHPDTTLAILNELDATGEPSGEHVTTMMRGLAQRLSALPSLGCPVVIATTSDPEDFERDLKLGLTPGQLQELHRLGY